MVGLKKLRKVRGSSLIEVITAMVIAGIVFSASSVIYLNVLRTSFSLQKTLAASHIQELVTAMELKKNYVSGEFKFDDITVYQDAHAYPNVEKAMLVTWEARDLAGKVLVERKRIWYVTNP